jgi:hypothetical protein
MATDSPFEDDEGLAIRWPKDEDRLFPDTGRASDTFIAGSSDERWYRLPKGYKHAGDILVEQILAGHIRTSDLIYPALFCYRQSLELFLKSVLERFDRRAANTHDLQVLWTQFEQMLQDCGQGNADGLTTVKKLVLEMHNVDRRSDTFRFATDLRGSPFPFGDRRLDLRRLAEIMQGLQNFFECCALALAEQNGRI